ncbi:MAG TPA: hypothetical protein VGO92_02740 [Acidimicrobiales bacterium]|jgi:hypothetical protein|nr:hypothetical protein [Acidimicrobiales bacterium]
MRRLTPALIALAALAALAGSGCGRGQQQALADVQSGLGAIKKGDLALRLTGGAGEEGGQDKDVGFEMKGPFDLSGPPGSLPVARLTLTRLLGATTRSVQFDSDGQKATVQADGRTVELTPEQAASLRLTKAKKANVAGLHLEGWAVGTPTQRRDGDAERFEADVDPVRVLNDVFGLAGQFGAGMGPIADQDADRLREAVRSSHMTAAVGASDNLLRDLDVEIVFSAADEARRLLGALGAARLHLSVRIDNPSR